MKFTYRAGDEIVEGDVSDMHPQLQRVALAAPRGAAIRVDGTEVLWGLPEYAAEIGGVGDGEVEYVPRGTYSIEMLERTPRVPWKAAILDAAYRYADVTGLTPYIRVRKEGER